MPAAISGGLLSSDFLTSGLQSAIGHEPVVPAALATQFQRHRRATAASLGPTALAPAVLSVSARPLAAWLGWTTSAAVRRVGADALQVALVASGAEPIALVVTPWSRDPQSSERSAASATLGEGLRWTLVTNGRRARLLDATRVPLAAALDFDLDLCAGDLESLARLHLLAGPRSFTPWSSAPTLLDHARRLSDADGARVCGLLRHGVRDALTMFEQALAKPPDRRTTPPQGDAQALTAVYRIVFLLFAEARGLVPSWHPIYRDGYTIGSLAERLEESADPRGLWAALQAMARLAHSGCRAGDLHVTAFNSRLFSPSASPRLDHLSLDDRTVGRAVEALVFRSDASGRRRISYADLGVEQLGSVYERLLDDRPASTPGASARKTSGSFYTPRAITDYLVRATLGPLVSGRGSGEILSLRILDPSMGSGAFLVSACRFLATAAERALIAEGGLDEHDIGDEERAGLRRAVAQRCLFGVDANPMAVQLAELSLWLATLAAEHPLSFLEHHLRCGDSLIGARPIDVMRRPPIRGASARAPLPLEQFFDEQEALAALLPERAALEERADTSADVVHEKERAHRALQHHPALVRWRDACDVWCALAASGPTGDRAKYSALIDRAFGRPSGLPEAQVTTVFARVTAIARARRAFHWPLEFPEIFLDAQGRPRPNGGFDAVLGNPPWEMLRADPGAVSAGEAVARFARESGLYTAQSRGHANEYQLFLERALQVLRPGGRLGMLVPSGLLTDAGSASLRRHLLERHNLESVAVFDNRRAIFPIHRGLRFVALTAVHSGESRRVRCRFDLDSPEQTATLDPSSGGGFPVGMTPALLHRLAGTDLAFPSLPSADDAALLERLTTRHPSLAANAGWGVTFGRELNATDDRDCLRDGSNGADLIVLDGRHLEPFRARTDRSSHRAARALVVSRLGARAGAIDRVRLGYREVASATNRTTLIAALIPAGAVTRHTIFCCRQGLAVRDAHALCGLLNSYVANYLVRRWVTTHVSATVMARLPVPCPDRRTRTAMAALARALASGPSPDLEARAQALAARAYGTNADELSHVLGTFPLVDRSARDAVLVAFRRAWP